MNRLASLALIWVLSAFGAICAQAHDRFEDGSYERFDSGRYGEGRYGEPYFFRSWHDRVVPYRREDFTGYYPYGNGGELADSPPMRSGFRAYGVEGRGWQLP